MKETCDDLIISYYLVYSKTIIKYSLLLAILFGIIIICCTLLKHHNNKEPIKKKIKKLIVKLLLIFLVPTTLIISEIIITNSSKYNICIEKEEQEAIKSANTKEEYVELKDEKKEENINTDEVIEVIEDDGTIYQEYLEQNKADLTKKENAIYFLNVGAATESFIIQDDGHFGLIDTSYKSKASFIVKQLKKLGAEKLDFVILTHAHLDHIGGYKKIISKIPVDTLYIKVPGNVNSNYIPIYYDLVKVSEEKNITICDVKEPLCQEFLLGNINIKLFNTDFYNSKGITDEDRSRVENANSIAALLTINNKKIYFASDIGDYYKKKKETKTSEKVGDIDVYKVSHHGYISYNNNLVSLSYLKPEYNIITNTKELSLEAVRRLKNTSPDYKRTYYTTDGTITLHVTSDGIFEFTQ